jgi:hypothetical protein
MRGDRDREVGSGRGESGKCKRQRRAWRATISFIDIIDTMQIVLA